MMDTKNQSIELKKIREMAQSIRKTLVPIFKSMQEKFLDLEPIIKYLSEHKEELTKNQIEYLLGEIIKLINLYSEEISNNNFLASTITIREIESHLREIRRLEYFLYQECKKQIDFSLCLKNGK